MQPAPPGSSLFPRGRPVNRSQLCWRTVHMEELVEEDHLVRAIWEFVGRLELTCFLAPINSVAGQARRTAFGPYLLISV